MTSATDDDQGLRLELNGTAVDRNLRAFDIGRWAVLFPEAAAGLLSPNVVELPKTLDDKIAFRVAHLKAYQGNRLAKRYVKLLDTIEDADVKEAVAKGYHKLLTYKDEYEVARLLLTSHDQAKAEFDGDLKLTYHLAPPIFGGKGVDGRGIPSGWGDLPHFIMPA